MLAAAEEVFSERGMHAAAMSEIAERAGVAVGTLYNHFKDREALLTELLGVRRAELIERLDACLAEGAAAPFRDQLAGFLRTILTHFEEHRAFFLILMQNETGSFAKPRETVGELLLRIDRLLEIGLQKKALRPGSEAFYPGFLLALVRTIIMREKYGTPPVDIDKATETVMEFFLHGAAK